jgi:hypothetical protein
VESAAADDNENEQRNALAEIARTFIGLSCTHFITRTGQDRRKFVVSGFLLSIRGLWYMATAGHVLEDISKLMAENPDRTFLFGIIDNFGPDAKHDTTIPFALRDALHWRTDDDTGADFGLICIDDHYRRQMETNPTIPISEAQWDYVRTEPFDFHLMVGIPAETLDQGLDNRINFSIASIPLTELSESDLPDTITPNSYPTFYAKLAPTQGLASIKGMSGCPIFGFARDENGNWRHWIVAVQSGWYPNQRIVYAGRIIALVSDAASYFDALVAHLTENEEQ